MGGVTRGVSGDMGFEPEAPLVTPPEQPPPQTEKNRLKYSCDRMNCVARDALPG